MRILEAIRFTGTGALGDCNDELSQAESATTMRMNRFQSVFDVIHS